MCTGCGIEKRTNFTLFSLVTHYNLILGVLFERILIVPDGWNKCFLVY